MKRVLFVDDDVNVLQGLKRMLRSIRLDWEMAFCESAENALELMGREEPFGVIVTDIQMPGMDGVELLTEVRKRYPKTIRFVLSGYANGQTVTNASSLTHQFLTKPCDPRVLHNLLARAFVLREHLSNARLEKAILELGTLPALPVLYQEVMREMRSPDPSVAKVAQIIAKDLAMSAKVLQIVNSAFVGLIHRVTNITHAASLLGLDNLRNLVLMVEVFSPLQERVLRHTVNVTALWDHSLKVGEYAMRIAKKETEDSKIVNECFTAGLLHDVGLIILAAKLPDELSEAFLRAKQGTATLLEAEKDLIGATHLEVGGYLLELWGLPDPIVEAVLYHGAPSACPETYYSSQEPGSFSALTAVHAANYLCDDETFGQPQVDAAYLERLGLAPQVDTWWDLCHRNEDERRR